MRRLGCVWWLAIVIVIYVLLSIYTPATAQAVARGIVQMVNAGWSASKVGGAMSSGAYRDLARQDALAAGIPPGLFERQIEEESGIQVSVVSPQGAVGMCQFLPQTAAGLGINPYDPVSCLKGAAQMMGRYYRQYGDYAKALAGYHCGGGCLAAAVRYGSAWGCHIPRSTQAYIRAIMGIAVCG
jgi:soluble lytic murein transglycosylase-like protein